MSETLNRQSLVEIVKELTSVIKFDLLQTPRGPRTWLDLLPPSPPNPPQLTRLEHVAVVSAFGYGIIKPRGIGQKTTQALSRNKFRDSLDDDQLEWRQDRLGHNVLVKRFCPINEVRAWREKSLMTTDAHGRGILVWKHVSLRPRRRRRAYDKRPLIGNLGFPYRLGQYFENTGGMACAGPIGALTGWADRGDVQYVMALYASDLRSAARISFDGVFYALAGVPVALYRAKRVDAQNYDLFHVAGEDPLALIMPAEVQP